MVSREDERTTGGRSGTMIRMTTMNATPTMCQYAETVFSIAREFDVEAG